MAEQTAEDVSDSPIVKRYVMVIYTGGTIGMKQGPDGLVPEKGNLLKLMASNPWLNDPQNITDEDKKRMKVPGEKNLEGPLAMKDTSDGFRIVYGILEFKKPIDSSNMNMDDWVTMVKCIKDYYQYFDGFLLLHGTDTMAFTSSALSFMIENLEKAVVITGSQLPLVDLSTDAVNNLIGSLIMSGQYAYQIPEVTLFFNNKLLRGNRSTKLNASEFDAFDSPNLPHLATVGVDITVEWNIIFRSHGQFKVYEQMSPDVGILRLFPGITPQTVESFLKPLKGAVLQTFGAGNSPDDIVKVLAKATKGKLPGNPNRVLILNITQCLKGTVIDIYATGTQLGEAGVVPGADMTAEAGLTKVSYLVARSDLDYETKQQMLQQSLRGELTPVQPGT